MRPASRARIGLFAVLAAVLCAASPAWSQSTATLQGTVSDAQGGVMPGVSVAIRNTATSAERAVVTNNAGDYVAAALQPGHYEIVAHVDGFADQKREIDLGPAQTVAVNLKLEPGTLAENVTVSGAAPLIDTATVAVGASMAEKTVQEIPLNGRHFVDLGPLMPGGSTSPQNAGLSAPLRGQGAFSFMSAGNRETSVNFMVNGINLNDLSNSQVTFQPSINTVSEFKVDNSTFSAEYGRNSGAIVNVATRSGSNQFHGEGFDFYRDQKFDSRNYFNPPPAPQSVFNRKQFGVNLGGPVAKNKMFFFGSYEGLRHTQARRPELRNAEQRAAGGGHRPAGEEPAPVHPGCERLHGPARDRIGDCPGHQRSDHGRRADESAAERRPARLLRVPARFPPRAERAGQHRAGLRRQPRRPPAGADA